MGIVVEVINELENFHITKEALEVGAFLLPLLTQIGHHFDGVYSTLFHLPPLRSHRVGRCWLGLSDYDAQMFKHKN
jgi:hypothetical protein